MGYVVTNNYVISRPFRKRMGTFFFCFPSC